MKQPTSACWYMAGVAASLLGLRRGTINKLCAEGKVRGQITTGQARGMWVEAFKGEDGRWRVPVEWLGSEYVRRTV